MPLCTHSVIFPQKPILMIRKIQFVWGGAGAVYFGPWVDAKRFCGLQV